MTGALVLPRFYPTHSPTITPPTGLVPVLPFRPFQDRTISNASIFEENYFFEWCVWLGYAVYWLAYGGWGVSGLLGQAVILASIFGVTGIPPTEAQSLR